ncbi:hypothetical protein VTJ49DRAFT_316 [Mycothermus thermophilus]|uniref:Pre-mRNA-splicing factor CWC26 n=1 Tax=Humicola insolens TaxID=85995 RepID=A0ABR3VFF3_HUMIN
MASRKSSKTTSLNTPTAHHILLSSLEEATMSDKAAYLAAHYLSVERKPSSSSSSKKRKRKHAAASSSSGLLITDDDETGWGSSSRKDSDVDQDDDIPMTVAGTSADFRRAKKSAWKTIGSSALTTASKNTPEVDSDAAAADAIIASAAAESRALAADADEPEDPATTTPQPTADTPMMSNGTLAGLQSAAALTSQLRARQEAEAAEFAAMQQAQQQQQAESSKSKDKSSSSSSLGEETILRDATGRRVDASLLRAAARRAQAEAERRERAKAELLRGEVQAQQAAARRQALEDAAVMPLARGKDDVELNEELKQQGRWHDPMAEFLGTDSGGGGGRKKRKGVKGQRPVYKGAAPPNRYGIRPGYRWDGVDRGNGFEAERFRALNRREMAKGLEYAWAMDE